MSSIEIKSASQIDRMRKSGKLAAATLVHAGRHIRAGMTTDDINTIVHAYIIAHSAYPSPLNYKGFPKSVCTSINEVVCHGIPGPRVVRDGDIINVDVTTYVDGYHGDTSATFYVGTPSEEARKVVEVSRRSLELGIAQVREGARIGDIGAAIQEYAEGQGCSVVREYVGHGIGREFHMAPHIPHFGKRGTEKRLKAGMTFTIEPMINLGTHETERLDDEWTVVTRDGRWSAQFEHTILVTRDGCEVLTSREEPLEHSETFPFAELGPLSTAAAYRLRHASSSREHAASASV